MRTETRYYIDGDYKAYYTPEDALKAEKANLERIKYWQENSASAKHNKLLHELEQANIIHPETIATCTIDSLKIKAMVKVCKNFYEENKDFLQYC